MGESQDGNRKISRRTYLKGAAATGVALSVAGCFDLGTVESTVIGLKPDWADSSGYVPADYRRVVNEYSPSSQNDIISSATTISHAVVYDREEQSGPTAGFGTFTTPIPTSWLGEHPRANPYATQSIQQLLASRTTARPLLEGVGVDVGSEVEWTERNHEELTARPFDLLGQDVGSYVLTNGVLRTGDERRAVLLLIARAKYSNPAEILFAGASLQQFVESGESSSSFREEYGQRIISDLAPPMANITQIDPEGDLPGLEENSTSSE